MSLIAAQTSPMLTSAFPSVPSNAVPIKRSARDVNKRNMRRLRDLLAYFHPHYS